MNVENSARLEARENWATIKQLKEQKLSHNLNSHEVDVLPVYAKRFDDIIKTAPIRKLKSEVDALIADSRENNAPNAMLGMASRLFCYGLYPQVRDDLQSR